MVLGGRLESLFRVVPPSLYLALAGTEGEEKAERRRIMQEAGCSELDAAIEIARRLDEFKNECRECEQLKSEFDKMLKDINTHQQTKSKESQKEYKASLQSIQGHLTKVHKLQTRGYFIGTGMGIGVAIGSGLSAAAGNYALMGAGIAIGVAVGLLLEARARKQGRML